VETALRTMAMQATPSHRELQMRLQAMGRLKELAQSGIHFCVGLDLEPYGSFVSGLYTPYGDLDLSIEGQATWRDEAGQVQRVTVDGMEREMKVKFLRALSNRIQAKRLCLGQVDRILHARVPILKFRDLSGLDFDVGIGGSHALFKSTILGLLAQFDWRFGALVRLVKLWARHHDVNDSTNGTLNSFALTLLVGAGRLPQLSRIAAGCCGRTILLLQVR
jgi:DNA polymerase sigma